VDESLLITETLRVTSAVKTAAVCHAWDGGFGAQDDVEEGTAGRFIEVILRGRISHGQVGSYRLKEKAGETKDNWLLVKEKDEYVKDTDGISEYTASVRTGRSMTEIEEGAEDKITRNPFDRAEAQLAKPVNTVPEGEDWLFEMKYDGYRILAFVECGGVKLITRNGNDLTPCFKDVSSSLTDWADGRAMVLDGKWRPLTKRQDKFSGTAKHE
jgi:bifunctional non-homologous end joining protein LigD